MSAAEDLHTNDANRAENVIVRLEGVTKTYKQGEVEVQALRGVDLTIERGEFTALIGPSGSGKTTVLNMIGALDEPTSGMVVVDGKDLGKMSRKERSHLRRDRIGFGRILIFFRSQALRSSIASR